MIAEKIAGISGTIVVVIGGTGVMNARTPDMTVGRTATLRFAETGGYEVVK